MELTALQQLVHQMYIAYYQRPADPEGLQYWVEQLEQNGDWTAVSAAFGAPENEENQALYGELNREQTIAAIYQSAFNREAVAEEVEFWAASEFSATDLTFAIINGAQNDDLATVNNKVEFSAELVAQLETNAAYAELQDPKALLTAVTSETDVTAEYVSNAVASGKVGETFSLTAATDSLIGTSANDTFNGATGSVQNADIILDQNTSDNDTANLTVTTVYTPANIANVENLNFNWDAFGTASYDLTNVKGAKNVTLASEKVGYLGSATVTNVDGVTLTAGAGTTGTLTASGFKTGAVEGGAAKSLVINGSATNADNTSITVNAGESTTSVSVGATNGFKTSTIDAGTATAVTIADAGNTSDVTNLTVNANATVTNNVTGKVNLTANDGNSVTMNAIAEGLDVAGTGTITLNSTGLTAETVTNNVDGTLNVVSSATGAQDVSKVDADLIQFTGNVNGALTFKTGANAELAGSTTTLATITGSAAKSEVVNLKASGATITTLAAAASLETLNLTAAAPAVAGTDLTVGTTTLNSNKLVVDGTNDVSLGNVTNAGTVDASALNGEFSLTQAGTGDILNVTGSETGKNTVTFTATTVASNYTGGNGEDTVVFAQTTGAGVASANAVVGNGKNTVTANTLTDGDLVVVGGSGDDTVSATAITDANVTLQLGDGNNTVTLGTADNVVLNDATINIVTGAGNDKVSLLEATTANTEVNLTLGGGTNTLALDDANYSLGTWSVSGLSAIELAGGATTTVASSLVSGNSIAVSATNNAADVFAVVGTTATGETIDLSNLAVDQTISKAVAGGVSITGNAGADTIIGTSIADTIVGGDGDYMITGGAGVDSLTGGNGKDTFVFAAGDSGTTATTADTIADFNSADDSIKLGVAGTANNYVEADAGGASTLAAQVTAAESAFASNTTGLQYYLAFNIDAGGNGALIVDSNNDNAADMVIQLTGVGAAAGFDFADIVA